MKKVKLLLLGVASIVASNALTAQNSSDKWLVGLGTHAVNWNSIRFNDSNRGASNYGETNFWKSDNWAVATPISTLTIGRSLSPSFVVDFFGSAGQLDNTRFDIDNEFFINAGLGVKYKFANGKILKEESVIDPYVRAGVNYHYYAYDNTPLGHDGLYQFYANGILTNVTQEQNYLTVAVGLGTNVWINKNRTFGLNLGLDYNLAPAGHRDYMNFLQANAGLVFRFGASDKDNDGIIDSKDACPEVAGLLEFNGCPDTDKDGIQDKDDACPLEAGLAEFNGCPDTDKDGLGDNIDSCPKEAGPKSNKGCPILDKDGDGINDDVDSCPNEAGPKSNKGCPWGDSDKDGLTDNVDKCPNEAGPKSNNGCPLKGNVLANVEELKGARIYFDTGKATIKVISTETLDKVYAFMQKHGSQKWRVEGHTDSVGKASSNLRLSQGRAAAVRDYFISKGMNSSQVRSLGYGEETPIADNGTKEGRSKNRRVEIYSE